MGKYFSDVVEKAIEDIYYCYDSVRAKAGAEALFLAAKEGDGDACYFLSRCFSGTCYSWEYHPFEENEEAAYAMLHKGISLGSAVAVLGALRMDMLTPELKEIMHFSGVKEAWDIVNEKAEAGCQFCQYVIGNTYYFLDVIEIEERGESEFESKDAWDDWRRDVMMQSVPLFEKAFVNGMGLAGRNLRNYYEDGRGTLIPPDPEKALEVRRQGAQMGYPDWMYELAYELCYKMEQTQEGLSLAMQAARLGHLKGWSIWGYAYYYGDGAEKDLSRALECFEKSAPYGEDPYSCGMAGAMYFLGQGAPQDYAKAVQYLEHCFVLGGRDRDTDMLGLCYLLGLGCRQDTARGRALLERSGNTKYKNYGLGMMFAEGLGVPEDIGKGVEYLRAAGAYEPAREALKNYKKSLFGIWRRRG